MFEGFLKSQKKDDIASDVNIIEPITTERQRRQQKDTSIKSLKERFNYASNDCAATVRKANKEGKGANSILYESKDQYMINKCNADKFVIINLCEPIRVDTIVMANFEFFSSTFKDFRVYVADRYPSNDWQLLGQWQARNTRDLQVFRVEDRSGWPEYMKIEFLSHYGDEYYCPLSLVRVYGMSMLEYYNRVERQGEDEEEEQHLWPSEIREQLIQPQFDVVNTSESFPIKHDDQDEILEHIIPPIKSDSSARIELSIENEDDDMMEESIYKTIMKRLNALELNATLSKRYLDDQNEMLNQVFLDMERRHQEQLMILIGQLNETASYKIESMVRFILLSPE
ncbi:hypothetical protein K501DRAFT_170253 [Backusella circina FSU 941]|nr:hypothetical protein K501DRAFT_170253 [Backusella circina FSU 941]